MNPLFSRSIIFCLFFNITKKKKKEFNRRKIAHSFFYLAPFQVSFQSTDIFGLFSLRPLPSQQNKTQSLVYSCFPERNLLTQNMPHFNRCSMYWEHLRTKSRLRNACFNVHHLFLTKKTQRKRVVRPYGGPCCIAISYICSCNCEADCSSSASLTIKCIL